MHKLRVWIHEWTIHLFHQFQLARLRFERLGRKMISGRSRPCVLATACWRFPIYSQTFVYQELTQLIKRGFVLKFLYSKLDSRKYCPPQFSRLWHARRKLILHPGVWKRDYDYFARRMPEKINTLTDMLCEASGMLPEELRSHHHFLQAFSFTRMAKAYQPDYLHSYFFYEGSLFTLIASYLLNIPRGVSCYADHMLKDYALKVVPLHMEVCDLVISTSQRIKEELMGLAPKVESDRIIVKPNAINADQFPAVILKNPGKEEAYRLVCVSRIEPKKGLIYLVEAVAILQDKGFKVEAHLIGGIDDNPASRDYAQKLKARIEKLKLSDIVHIEGTKRESDIKQFFRISDLFIAPFIETESGDKDGVPTCLLEAMASGLPVVATDAGSILEVIEHGQDGVIVAQRDANALAVAIADLMNNYERRVSLGKGATRKIREKFNVSICEDVFHKRLSEVFASRAEEVDGGKANEINETKVKLIQVDRNGKKGLVSVIMIFLNAEKFVQEAIESVLAQTYDNWELLLVDDGSTDSSTEIAKRYADQYPEKVHYLEHEGHQNKGMSATRNLGVRHANSEYIAFLDADDVWLPHKLDRQVSILNSHPEVGMVYGSPQYWYSWTGNPEDLERDYVPDLGIQAGCVFEAPKLTTLLYPLGKSSAPCPSDLLMRREVIEQAGGFEESFRREYQLYEDQAFLAKVYLKESVFVASECWDKYRIHPDSCVAKITEEGKYHSVRLFFLNWLEEHLSEKGIKDVDVWDELQKAFRPYRPVLSENGRRAEDIRRIKWQLRVGGDNLAELVLPPDNPDAIRVAINKAETKTSFDIQLNQPRLKIRSNQSYTLNFRARADSPRSISLGVAKNHEPWDGLGLYSQIDLTSEWQSFRKQFVATANDNDARIHFDLGSSEISVDFSSVSLCSLADGEAIESDLPPIVTDAARHK